MGDQSAGGSAAARALTAARGEVLRGWVSRASSARGAAGLTQDEIVNAVPQYLDALICVLDRRERPEELERIVDAHVANRLRQGFHVHEIVQEFVILGQCIGHHARLPDDGPDVDRLFTMLGDAIACAMATVQRHLAGEGQAEAGWLRQLDGRMSEALEAPGAWQEELGAVAELVQKALGADAAELLLCEGHSELRVLAASGLLAARAGARRRLSESHFAARLARASESGVLLEEFAVERLDAEVAQTGLTALLGHPLRARGALLGVLYVGTHAPRPFTPTQHRHLRALAQRLGLLIENARLLESLRASLEDLRGAEEARDRFVSVLAHDLRGPIATARLHTDRLLRGGRLTAGDVAVARRAVHSLERTDRMIRDLLDVHLVSAGNPLPLKLEACVVEDVVRGALEQLEQAFGARFALHVSPDAASAVCMWDAEEVRRALWNLGSNAVKYGEPTKPVTLRAGPEQDGIVLSVHNEGPPLAPERIAELLRPSGRTGATAGGKTGWGLGLTLVRAVVEAHGGRIGVTSDAAGTTFSMWLPKRNPA